MLGRKSATWRFVAVAVPLAVVVAAGCATTTKINHAYVTSTNFGPLRRYAWAPGSSIYSPDSLVEANVQSLADPLLEKKGFERVTATPDLVISVRLGGGGNYELQVLDLNVYRADGRTLLWRGTASGWISTDAASSDLRNAVQGILATFPPD